MTNLDGFAWLLALLAPLLFLQRRLHREVQAVFLLVTRRVDISLILFSILFLPGVLLHEASHYLAAILLGVRTGRLSLIPKATRDGRLQLGYVETASTDPLRDALIGTAPLIAGGIFVVYAGIVRLGLPPLGEYLLNGDYRSLAGALSSVFSQADFWLWFYLTFVVSSTMLPSASDRRAWIPVAVVFLGLFVAGLAAGAGPWMLAHLAPPLNRGMRVLATVFAISVALHFVLWAPLWGLRSLLSRLTGFHVAG